MGKFVEFCTFGGWIFRGIEHAENTDKMGFQFCCKYKILGIKHFVDCPPFAYQLRLGSLLDSDIFILVSGCDNYDLLLRLYIVGYASYS